MDEVSVDPVFLQRLAQARMPFGKYKGDYLSDLPEAYLVWFRQQGWPKGELGQQLATMLEVAHNGQRQLIQRIREMG